MKASWKKHTLQFKKPAGTSRGTLHTKDSYFLILEQGERRGIGECGLLKGLSADDRPDYETTLQSLVENINETEAQLRGDLNEFPSIQFGLEMALKDLDSENLELFPSEYTRGKAGQPINGLIWMGDVNSMKDQIAKKIDTGFSVLKMKIGAISIEDELSILKMIRQEYNAAELELRVDANGAFQPADAVDLLKRLGELDIHSIEQPIAKGQWQEMAALCEASPIDIALDEELIGIFDRAKARKLMSTINPQYIILKPSFIGGWKASEEWIALANDFNTGWWVTSALESNVGLNAIAQWNFTQNNPMPSGLGTGSLYTNNFESPMHIENGKIYHDPKRNWNLNNLA